MKKLITTVSLVFILAGNTSAEQLSDFNIGAGAKVGWLNLNEENFEDTPFMGIFLTGGSCHFALELAGEYFVVDRTTGMIKEKLNVTSILGTLKLKSPIYKNRVSASVGFGLGAYELDGKIKNQKIHTTEKMSVGNNPRLGYHFAGAISASFGKLSAVFIEAKYQEVAGAGVVPFGRVGRVVAMGGMRILSVSAGLIYYLL